MTDLDEHLDGIRAGDPDAFGRWVAGAELHLRLSLSSFAEQVDVEAVLQESLLRVWQVAPRVRPDGRPNALLRFAIRVCRNHAIDETRRLKSTPAEDGTLGALMDPVEPSPPDPLLRRVIVACREKLPGKPAAALDARLGAAGSEPDAALAARLEMRLNTFLQNVTRARKLLAECLRRHGVELAEVPR